MSSAPTTVFMVYDGIDKQYIHSDAGRYFFLKVNHATAAINRQVKERRQRWSHWYDKSIHLEVHELTLTDPQVRRTLRLEPGEKP